MVDLIRGRRRRSGLGLLLWLWRLGLLAVLAVLVWVLVYTRVDPPTTLLIERERARLGAVTFEWRPLDAISPHLPLAVMAAEDARFCEHGGFDFVEMRRAWEERARGRIRGASTISQQVAKNAFLWPEADWVRKGLEAGFTVLIEAFWGKRRIMEVYLNIAEMGPGVFGAEAAAQHWFGKSADRLTAQEAARIAAILPGPRTRSASRPSAFVAGRVRAAAAGAQTISGERRDACLR
jgi:monofunctional biosynthetic peptidoglycan transglycosylase